MTFLVKHQSEVGAGLKTLPFPWWERVHQETAEQIFEEGGTFLIRYSLSWSTPRGGGTDVGWALSHEGRTRKTLLYDKKASTVENAVRGNTSAGYYIFYVPAGLDVETFAQTKERKDTEGHRIVIVQNRMGYFLLHVVRNALGGDTVTFRIRGKPKEYGLDCKPRHTKEFHSHLDQIHVWVERFREEGVLSEHEEAQISEM